MHSAIYSFGAVATFDFGERGIKCLRALREVGLWASPLRLRDNQA